MISLCFPLQANFSKLFAKLELKYQKSARC
jgi:hypothetical protein